MSLRRRLRWAVLAVVILLLGGVTALVVRTVRQRPEVLIRQGLEALPGVTQHIQNFRRVKVQNGRTVWEVAAEEGSFFEAENTVVVRDAVVEWHMEDGRTVGLRGQEGRIVLDGGEVKAVELRGDIRVDLADYVVRTDEARYDHALERIDAPGRIEIRGAALDLDGEGMQVDVAAQRLTILRHVSMHLRPEQVPETSTTPADHGHAAQSS